MLCPRTRQFAQLTIINNIINNALRYPDARQEHNHVKGIVIILSVSNDKGIAISHDMITVHYNLLPPKFFILNFYSPKVDEIHNFKLVKIIHI